MNLAVTLLLFCLLPTLVLAQQPADPVIQSWQQVLASYPDAAKDGSPTHKFLQAQIDEIQRTDPDFFNQSNWPEVIAFRNATQLQALKGAVKSPEPVATEQRPKLVKPPQNFIAFERDPSYPGANSLTIDNGTDHCAIVKLINAVTGAKEYAFVVLPGQKQPFAQLHDGTYRMVFALGDVLVDGEERFDPCLSCAEFQSLTVLSTRKEGDLISSSDNSITLHPVAGGNVKTKTVATADFEKW